MSISLEEFIQSNRISVLDELVAKLTPIKETIENFEESDGSVREMVATNKDYYRMKIRRFLAEKRKRTIEPIPDSDAFQVLEETCEDQFITPAVVEWLVDLDFGRLASMMMLVLWSMGVVVCMTEVRKEEGDQECPICMEQMKLFRVTPCGHSFHDVCLFKWLASSIPGSDDHSDPHTCPMCRSNLNSD